jgi:hypothetical protein
MPIHERSRATSTLRGLIAIALLFQLAALSDTEYRKSANGFLIWLLVTDDEDWESELDTDPDHVPSFSEVDELRVGDEVTVLILIANPKQDPLGNVDVDCDLHVQRADGSVSMDRTGADCLSGPLLGNPRSVRVAAPTMVFLGERGDPTGPWEFTVTIRDAHLRATVVLTKSITLKAR